MEGNLPVGVEISALFANVKVSFAFPESRYGLCFGVTATSF